jgi:hypothetical protein
MIVLSQKKWRGAPLIVPGVLGYLNTNKRAHAETWAFYLLARVLKTPQFSRTRLEVNASNILISSSAYLYDEYM